MARRELIHRIAGRRILCVAFTLIAVPAGLVGSWLTASDWGAIVGGAAFAALAAAAGIALTLTQCPQCRDLLFISNTAWSNPWASRCAHCGLSLSTWPEEPAHRKTVETHAPDNNEMQRPRHGQNGASPLISVLCGPRRLE